MKDNLKNALRSTLNRLGLDLVTNDTMRRFEAFHRAARHAPDLLDCVIRQERAQGAYTRFLQIGSNDGIRDDHLRKHILSHGLHGLMVEPNPGPFARLQSLYSKTEGIVLANCAVGPEVGQRNLYVFADQEEKGVPLDLYSAFDRQQLERVKHRNGYRSAIRSILVEVQTIHNLIDRYGLQDASLLIIDTEGYDFEILKSIDLQVFQPRLIQMEHSNLSGSATLDAVKFLVNAGYETSMGWRDMVGIRGESSPRTP